MKDTKCNVLIYFDNHSYRKISNNVNSSYGVKLTELHVDVWTIAKLLGHKGVKSVQYHRKNLGKRKGVCTSTDAKDRAVQRILL